MSRSKSSLLQHKWSFFLHYPTFSLDARNYSSQAYEKLSDVCNVDSFWKAMDEVPKPSDVFSSRDSRNRMVRAKVNGKHLEAFGLFKTGPKPEWEDPLNLKGGHWECRQDFPLQVLDRLWYEMILAMVGEVLEEGRDLVGARVVDKSKTKKTEYRLEIWISTSCQDVRDEILTNVQRVLAPFDDTLEFTWKNHGESLDTAIWCNAQDLGIEL